jgi:hypothetical protein
MSAEPKAALDALTDQAIAHLAAEQRKTDALTRVQADVARDLAGLLLTQFGDDHVLAGRVVVTTAQALSQMLMEMRGRIPEYQLATVMANVLAFAGERVVHHKATPGGAA